MSGSPPSGFGPQEPAVVIFTEKAIFNGAALGAVAYGINIAQYLLSAPLLWADRRKSPKYAYGMLAFITAIFSFGSIANGAALYINQLNFIEGRNFPGGPSAFAIATNSITINIVGTAFYFFNQWLQDGLLLYRLWMLSVTYRSIIMIIPTLLYLATIVSSCFLLAELSVPGRTIWQQSSVNITLTYWATAVTLNLLLTLLIVSRLLYMRFRMRKLMGPDHRSPYLSISAMVVESALVYSAFDLVFIITYSINSPVNFIVFPCVGQVESIAPLLIVLRVAQGRAFTRETVENMTRVTRSIAEGPMQFARSDNLSIGTTLGNKDTIVLRAQPSGDLSLGEKEIRTNPILG